MNNLKKIVFFLLTITAIQSCGFNVNYYNLTGIDLGDAKTFQVNFFKNYASQNSGSTIEPGLDRDFTQALQELLLNQTKLDLTTSNSDLLYEGEIVEYKISPMTATAQQTAAQNRLTMTVNVRFFNHTKEDSDFESRFSFFFDYPANAMLQTVKNQAHHEIFERLTQEIFNKSLYDI